MSRRPSLTWCWRLTCTSSWLATNTTNFIVCRTYKPFEYIGSKKILYLGEMFGVLVRVELGSSVPGQLRCYLNYLDFDFSNFGPNLVADWAVCEDPFRLFRGTGYYFQDYIILKKWKNINFEFLLTVISICILVWCIICGSGCWSLGWLRLETRIFF